MGNGLIKTVINIYCQAKRNYLPTGVGMRQKIFSCLIALFTLTFLGCDNRSAQDYIQSAKVQYQDNQTQGAFLDLKNAIALEPQNVEARKNLGLYYLEAGFFSEAEKELCKARELGNKELVVFTSVEGLLADLLVDNKDQDLSEVNAGLAMMTKDYARAVPMLKDYYNVAPSFDTAKLLATSLANTGNALEGGRYLEHERLKMSVAFQDVHYIAEYYASNDIYDRAAKHCQKMWRSRCI